MRRKLSSLICVWFSLACCSVVVGQTAQSLWDTAQQNTEAHRFSTLFTAQQVSSDLSSDEDIEAAIDWCRSMGITKVYLETFRTRHWVQADTIAAARDRFRDAGFLVSGCVTPTRIGKISTGWELISCYTDETTQRETREIFEFTAQLFDEIMIDDFWFTDCQCDQCQHGLQKGQVEVDGQVWPFEGDQWSDYRCELMLRVSQELVLQASRQVNPKVKVIIKYPQWYDDFQNRGYDVLRQTAEFDWTWVGTEIRDEHDSRWGGRGRMTAYFLQSWLEGLSGQKCGGGWYDTLGTTPPTYLIQARQTILGGAKESMLFNAGNLRFKQPGTDDALALRNALPQLLDLAKNVNSRRAVGVTLYKPPSSHGGVEKRVFEHVPMMGIPVVTSHQFPTDAPAAFFSLACLDDPQFVSHLEIYLASGRPTLVTDGLAQALGDQVDLSGDQVQILELSGDPSEAWKLPAERLDAIRKVMLKPFEFELSAPNRVSLYAFEDGSWVLGSFHDEAISVGVNGVSRKIAPHGFVHVWK